jgi:hypothetical protein
LGEAIVSKGKCKFCGIEFGLDEETVYKDICVKCAEQNFPLAFAVRRRILEYHGVAAARDVFTEEHGGCLPDSMLGDDIAMGIISLFKCIGHVVAEAAGLPEEQHTVIVEPSYEDTTWWLVTKEPPEATVPQAAQSQIVLFDYVKVWHLGGHNDEGEVEEMLRNWKDEIVKSLLDVKLLETAVQAVKSAKISCLS